MPFFPAPRIELEKLSQNDLSKYTSDLDFLYFIFPLLPVPTTLDSAELVVLVPKGEIFPSGNKTLEIEVEIETITWALCTNKPTDYGGAYYLGSARMEHSGKENS